MYAKAIYSYRRIIGARKLPMPIYRMSIDITNNIWYSLNEISTCSGRVLITVIAVEILYTLGGGKYAYVTNSF